MKKYYRERKSFLNGDQFHPEFNMDDEKND